ncbi:MAG: hypothetical protein ACRDFC_09055, partial [Ignavibacteria bacterium]
MKIFFVTLIFFAVLTLNSKQASSQDFAKVHELITEGINAIYNIDFNKALSKFQSAKSVAPNDLRGPFFESTLYFWKALFNRNKTDYETYLNLSDKLIEKCENVV